MSFSQISFLGASVRGVSTSIGWGVGQPSQLSVQLVEDVRRGDVFTPVEVGTPAYFELGAFRFSGLLQKWEQRQAVDGKPVYEAILVDPREILEGAQVILGAFNGSVGTVKNLFNAFGYWENQGFGLSATNDSGMPWHKIRDAVLNIANQPNTTNYGGPLNFKGVTYGLDLSEVPNPPSYYRIGGVSASLLEIIAQICEDGGRDFFVELNGYTIKVRTVSRADQPPLGTISAIVNANYGGSVIRGNNGLEARNEITSSFLVGGEQTTLYLTDDISTFWGYDIDGNPITGTLGITDIKDRNGNVLQSVNDEYMSLNASPISDIVGSVRYACSVLEMRCAKIDYLSWEAYMTSFRPDFAEMIGLPGFIKNMGPGGVALKQNFVNDGRQIALALMQDAVIADKFVKAMRVYEFVRGYADEYMGKKYLAGMPFVLQKIDEETLKVTNSYEVADGGFVEDGAAPLGLSELNSDVFRNPDGRYRSFVEFQSLIGADLSQVSPQGTVIEGTFPNNVLFEEVRPDASLVFNPFPSVLITLNSPLLEEADDIAGNIGIVAGILQQDEANGKALLKQGQFGNFGLKIAPAVRHPSRVAIPLKSNLFTYGPWYVAGAPGKVKFEYDPSLTPWNYGGYDVMALAGNARVSTALTNMQTSEAGSLELAGAPTVSLGDVLQSGGPNVTNIDVQFGVGGVTTSYRFQTYTPRFGVFGKGNTERMKRQGLVTQELKRSLRSSVKKDLANQEAAVNAARTARAWFQHAPKPIKKESPHDVLTGMNVLDDDGNVRVGVSTATLEEAVGLTNADDDAKCQATSAMSLGGLLRPFCTQEGGGNLMSSYVEPEGTFAALSIINKASYDPWKDQNDIEVYLWGDSYEGLHAFRRGGNTANARPMALRGPLVMSGWGFDIGGEPVPTDGEGGFAENYLKRSDTWKTGPVDLVWDENRAVWSCHDVRIAKSQATIAAGASGLVTVWSNGGTTSLDLYAYNWSPVRIDPDDPVVIYYDAVGNRWVTQSPPDEYVKFAALTMPTQFAVSGSPITASGTFGVTWNNQTASTFLAGPTSGSSTTPTFRAIASGDIPNTLNANARVKVYDDGMLNATRRGLNFKGTNIGISFTDDVMNDIVKLTLTGNAGTATSVGLSLPSGEFTVSGSPVTSAGTLVGTWKSQAASTFFAGPPSGSATTPTFRSIGSGDLPSVIESDARVNVYKNGSLVGLRHGINFIPASGIAIDVAANAGLNAVDVTIQASGIATGGGGTGTKWRVGNNDSIVLTDDYVTIFTAEGPGVAGRSEVYSDGSGGTTCNIRYEITHKFGTNNYDQSITSNNRYENWFTFDFAGFSYYLPITKIVLKLKKTGGAKTVGASWMMLE